MVAGDVYRPAAIDQLASLGEKIDIPVFYDKEDKSPVSIAKAGIDFAKKMAMMLSSSIQRGALQ